MLDDTILRSSSPSLRTALARQQVAFCIPHSASTLHILDLLSLSTAFNSSIHPFTVPTPNIQPVINKSASSLPYFPAHIHPSISRAVQHSALADNIPYLKAILNPSRDHLQDPRPNNRPFSNLRVVIGEVLVYKEGKR